MNYAKERENELIKTVIEPNIKADLKSFWDNEVKKMREVPLSVYKNK